MEISSFPFAFIPTTTTATTSPDEFDLIHSPFPFPPPSSSSSLGAFPVSQTFCSVFSDMEWFGVGGDGGGSHFKRRMEGDDGEDGEDRKRDYFGDGSSGGSDLKEILTSLELLEEEERQDREKWVLDFDRERSELDANRRRVTLEMGSYREAMDGHYNAANEIEESKAKRMRRSARATAAAAVAGVVTESAGSGGNSGAVAETTVRRLWVKDRSKDWWERLNSMTIVPRVSRPYPPFFSSPIFPLFLISLSFLRAEYRS